MEKHLWEYNHPYYCEEDNYFGNDCSRAYDSWENYMEEMGDADQDYNLLFRWDWKPASNVDNVRCDKLCLYYMAQRKGLYYSHIVDVRPEDEAAVKEYLMPRWEHMKKLWEPFGG